jgi:hypothetical protein
VVRHRAPTSYPSPPAHFARRSSLMSLASRAHAAYHALRSANSRRSGEIHAGAGVLRSRVRTCAGADCGPRHWQAFNRLRLTAVRLHAHPLLPNECVSRVSQPASCGGQIATSALIVRGFLYAVSVRRLGICRPIARARHQHLSLSIRLLCFVSRVIWNHARPRTGLLPLRPEIDAR